MLDPQIRVALASRIQAADANAALFHELPLRRGAGRADVAAVNGALAGFEIKSERDSLRRLARQVPLYDATFEYATIVVATTHLRRVRYTVPTTWGIKVAEWRADGPIFRDVRSPKRRTSTLDPNALVRLMWKRECITALRNCGLEASAQTPVRGLWEAMASQPLSRVLEEVRRALRSRRVGR